MLALPNLGLQPFLSRTQCSTVFFRLLLHLGARLGQRFLYALAVRKLCLQPFLNRSQCSTVFFRLLVHIGARLGQRALYPTVLSDVSQDVNAPNQVIIFIQQRIHRKTKPPVAYCHNQALPDLRLTHAIEETRCYGFRRAMHKLVAIAANDLAGCFAKESRHGQVAVQDSEFQICHENRIPNGMESRFPFLLGNP